MIEMIEVKSFENLLSIPNSLGDVVNDEETIDDEHDG